MSTSRIVQAVDSMGMAGLYRISYDATGKQVAERIEPGVDVGNDSGPHTTGKAHHRPVQTFPVACPEDRRAPANGNSAGLSAGCEPGAGKETT